MTINQKDMNAALCVLLKKGTVWAKCPKCAIPLSLNEFKKLKCESCGKINLKGKEHITFHPATTNVC